MADGPQPGDPSPAEIRKRCKQIQKGWSARQKRKRGSGGRVRQPWVLPIVEVSDILDRLDHGETFDLPQ